MIYQQSSPSLGTFLELLNLGSSAGSQLVEDGKQWINTKSLLVEINVNAVLWCSAISESNHMHLHCKTGIAAIGIVLMLLAEF